MYDYILLVTLNIFCFFWIFVNKVGYNGKYKNRFATTLLFKVEKGGWSYLPPSPYASGSRILRVLQNELTNLENWEKARQLKFNPEKCDVIRVTKKKKPLN
jgi:hypothetical protein